MEGCSYRLKGVVSTHRNDPLPNRDVKDAVRLTGDLRLPQENECYVTRQVVSTDVRGWSGRDQ
jgi:hypothetical protein